MPPAADIKPEAEPLYPVAALVATTPQEAETAERGWWNEILLWGRSEHAKITRICSWAATLSAEFKLDLPKDWCQE